VDVNKALKHEKMQLKITLYGKEKVAIMQNGGPQRSSKAENEFLTASSVLWKSSERPLLPGEHVFPFLVPLPVSVPSSASFPPGNKLNGFRVQYKIRAEIYRVASQVKTISVRSSPLPNTKVPYMVEPTSFPIQGLFFKRGTVTIGAAIDDTQVGRGQEVDIFLACHNDSTAIIQNVSITLYEVMSWSTDVQQRQASTTLLALDNVALSGTERHGASLIRRLVEGDRNNNNAQIYREIHESLANRRNRIRFKVPQEARDSYNGKLVRVSHFVDISFKTDVGASNPAQTIPIKIGCPPVKEPRSSTQSFSSSMPTVARQRHSSISSIIETTGVNCTPNNRRSDISYASTDTEEAPIPIVNAVPIVPEVAERPSIDVTRISQEDVIVLGGNVVLPDATSSLSTPIPVAPPNDQDVSLTGLLQAMRDCVNGHDLIERRLCNPEWVEFFGELSVAEYGTVVAQVSGDFDQTRVAALLAPFVNGGGDNFTCRYAAEAVRNASEWNRSNMAQRLVPLCCDIADHHQLVRSQLNEWEQLVASRDFEDAIATAHVKYTSRQEQRQSFQQTQT